LNEVQLIKKGRSRGANATEIEDTDKSRVGKERRKGESGSTHSGSKPGNLTGSGFKKRKSFKVRERGGFRIKSETDGAGI
jgi:hypothetical protein